MVAAGAVVLAGGAVEGLCARVASVFAVEAVAAPVLVSELLCVEALFSTVSAIVVG